MRDPSLVRKVEAVYLVRKGEQAHAPWRDTFGDDVEMSTPDLLPLVSSPSLIWHEFDRIPQILDLFKTNQDGYPSDVQDIGYLPTGLPPA